MRGLRASEALVQKELERELGPVCEETVGTGELLFHLGDRIERIWVIEHTGFPHKGCLPVVVQFGVIVWLAGY